MGINKQPLNKIVLNNGYQILENWLSSHKVIKKQLSRKIL